MKHTRLLDMALVIFAIALGGYLIGTRGAPTRTELASRANNVLPAFLPDELTRIGIDKPGKPLVVLRRDTRDAEQPSYFLGEKSGAHADPVEISELISSLDFSTWVRKLESTPLAGRRYGFDEPVLEVSLEAGPRSYRLVFGANAPSPLRSRYLLLEGSSGDRQMGVVSDDFFKSLHKDASELRGAILFPYSRRETSKLYLNRQDEDVVLVADALGFVLNAQLPGKWDRPRADRTLSDLIFLQLARAKLEEYRPRTEVEKGLAEASERIEVIQQSPNGPEYRVILGGDCDEAGLLTFAQRVKPNETFGCVTRSVLAAMRLTKERLIDRTALPLQADEIDHVTIELADKKLDLIRRDAKYVLLSNDEKTIPQETGDDFMQTLSSAPLLLIEPPKTEKLNNGLLTARGQSPLTAVVATRAGPTSRGSQDNDGVRTMELEIFVAENHETVYLHRLDDHVWLQVPPQDAWAFLPDGSWTRDRVLGNFEEQQVRQVRIQVPHQHTVTLVRDGDHFEFESNGHPADEQLTRRFLAELAHLQAVRFHSPPRQRPNRDLFEIEWKVVDRGVTRTERLAVGARVRGGHLAWSTLSPGSFVLSFDTRAILRTPLLDRSKFRIDPEQIAALQVQFGDQTYEFGREAGLLRAQSGASDDDMVGPLQDALQNLDVLAGFQQLPAELGPSRPIPQIRLKVSTSSEEETFNFGPALLFEGIPARLGWLEGQPETYLISAKSCNALEEIL